MKSTVKRQQRFGWNNTQPTWLASTTRPLLVLSGRLVLTDAAQQDAVEVPVERTTRRVRVYIDDEDHPELVLLSLDQPEC